MSRNLKTPDITYPTDNIVSSVKGFIEEAEGLLNMTKEFSSESLEAVKDEFESKLKSAKKTLAEIEKTTVKKARAADEYVHEKPWPIIGAAAAAGFLFGYFTRSRGDKE